jgi:hypothetical protein
MQQFKDSANPPRLWNVSINVGTVKRVKMLLPEIDLLEISTQKSKDEPPLIVRLAVDVCLLCDVLYAICKPQADALQVTDEQFGEAMGGDALSEGQQALMGELTDFFQKLGRTEQATVVRQAGTMIEATIAAADKRIKTLDMAMLSDSAVGKLFTAARASLDSDLTSSPSAN